MTARQLFDEYEKLLNDVHDILVSDREHMRVRVWNNKRLAYTIEDEHGIVLHMDGKKFWGVDLYGPLREVLLEVIKDYGLFRALSSVFYNRTRLPKVLYDEIIKINHSQEVMVCYEGWLRNYIKQANRAIAGEKWQWKCKNINEPLPTLDFCFC